MFFFETGAFGFVTAGFCCVIGAVCFVVRACSSGGSDCDVVIGPAVSGLSVAGAFFFLGRAGPGEAHFTGNKEGLGGPGAGRASREEEALGTAVVVIVVIATVGGRCRFCSHAARSCCRVDTEAGVMVVSVSGAYTLVNTW